MWYYTDQIKVMIPLGAIDMILLSESEILYKFELLLFRKKMKVFSVMKNLKT